MQYEKDELYATKIGILQKYARAIGVKAPTCLNKRALIQEIMLVQSGEKRPCAPNKKGRPVKDNGEPILINNIVVDDTAAEKNTVQKKKPITIDPEEIKEYAKQECIARILNEIERKLNNLL